MKDYQTNLKTSDDFARAKKFVELTKVFGYCPIRGCSMSDLTTAENLLKAIIRDYPGYQWVVEVRDTIVTVVNETLASNWGFRLRERILDNDGKVIRSFAGGLLERYKLKAGAMNPERVAEIPTNPRGERERVGE